MNLETGTELYLDYAVISYQTITRSSDLAVLLTDIGLDHLVSAAVTGSDIVDGSIFALLASSTGDWDSFSSSADSLQAIRVNGDNAWITATGFAVAGDPMNLVNDAITSAKIATDAIGSDALAATAVSEIQSGLATASALSAHDAKLDTVDGNIDTILLQVTPGGTLYDNIAAIKALWDSLTITGGYLEVDVVNLDGTPVKSTDGNIHALPGNI